MNKQQKIERKQRVIVVRRISSTLKSVKLANVRLNDTQAESVIAQCKTQASMIEACLRASMTLDDAANKLVEHKLCSDKDSATKRIKRHVLSDKASRIIKRNAIINSRVKQASEQASEAKQ